MSKENTKIKDLTKIYGKNSFGLSKLKEAISSQSYKDLKSALRTGTAIKSSTADEVAGILKNWALSKGATHFAHIFYPLTGYTAEKHDGFVEPTGERCVTKFAGKTLIQGEPDASSFPNGGIRGTHQARGYTIWDISSPAYITENAHGATLCIPSVFVSWTGEALDHKLPILRSERALDSAAKKVLKYFSYKEDDTIASTAGCEQEYFLIDENYYYSRPDLMVAERTVFGAASAKGQEFSDHYFGAIPERVINFMADFENELYKLGIPAISRHNEVAPGQFEIAPIFESSNVAADHQQIIMRVIKDVARKHKFFATLHEKPFAGINGSGKHLNWSLGNGALGNLLDPKNLEKNYRFQLLVAAVIQAVDKNASLLRAAAASAGNDHRLGANEAPPAIISIFLGEELTNFLQNLGKKSKKDNIDSFLDLGLNSIPTIAKDSGDRNRTSPFAFTGNKFEFRAIGSNQNVGFPITILNTIMADSLELIAKKLSRSNPRSKLAVQRTVSRVVKAILKEHGKVIFNGDGYSEEWHKEAVQERKLPQHKTTPEALKQISNAEYIELFEKHNVLSKPELLARQTIFLEQYAMKVNVEVNVALQLAKRDVLPAAVTYLNEIKSISSLKNTNKLLDSLIADADQAIYELDTAVKNNSAEKAQDVADYAQKTLLLKLANLREVVDQLEEILPADSWGLPTYQEMLFNK